MKKLVLKYLPIPLALILALVGAFTLFSLTSNRYEYATVSYASRVISVDMSVSNNGTVVKVIPADNKSNEALVNFKLDGMHVSDAVVLLSGVAEENETVYVGAYIHEDREVEGSEMKTMLDSACSKIEVSCLGTYGVYNGFDFKRAVSYDQTIGKITYASHYADTVTQEFSLYMDSYLIYAADPYEMMLYAKYVGESIGKDAEELFSSDFSHVKNNVTHISEDEAKALSFEFLETTLNWKPDSLSFAGFRFDEGDLGYAFNFRYNGENRVTFVDVVNGSVREYFLDDY